MLNNANPTGKKAIVSSGKAEKTIAKTVNTIPKTKNNFLILNASC